MRKEQFQDTEYILYFIPRSTKTRDEIVPHDVVEYRVNVQSLETDFTEAVKMWARNFKDELKNMWEVSAAEIIHKYKKLFRTSWGKIRSTFQRTLEEDKQIIGVINQKKEGFKEKVKQLEELRKKLLIV